MHRVVASWFGTGLILERVRGSHLGSGTLGAVFAFPVALAIGHYLGWEAQIAAVAVVAMLSIWTIGHFVDEEGDAGWMVVDEVAGAFLALIGLAFWPGAVVALLVFRAADIFKRWFPGVAEAERLPGALGVTADDLVAGLYGLAAGHLAQTLF